MIVDFIQLEIGIESRADSADNRADFLVRKDLIEPLLLDVERLASQGKNGLKLTDTRLLCRAARRVALYDKHFVEFRLSA